MRRASVALLLVQAFFSIAMLACQGQQDAPTSQCNDAVLDEARSLEDLADFYVNSSEFDQSLPLYQDALAIRGNCPEADPLSRTETNRKLAQVYSRLERYDESIPHYRSALDILADSPGVDQSNLARLHDGLANAYAHLESYQEALAHYQQALEIRRNATDASPLEVATSHHNVASMFVLQGDYEKAVPGFESALEIRKASTSISPLDLALSHHNLANAYTQAGSYQKALPHYQEVLTIRQDNPQADPLDIAASHEQVADTLSRLEAFAQALPHYQEVLSIRRNNPQAAPLDIAASHEQVADTLSRLGSVAEALPHYQQVLSIREDNPQVDPLDIAASHERLGQTYVNTGNHEEALHHYRESVRIRRENPGAEPIERATAYNNLALLYRYLGQYGQAEPLLKEAIKIIEETRGPNHLDTAVALNNLADLYIAIGNFAEALPPAERALEIRSINPDASPGVLAESFNNTAAAYYQIGEHQRALELLQRSLEIKEDELGRDNPAIAPFINNLAVIYRSLGEDGLALQQYLRALEIRQRDPGPDHPDTAMSMNNLAALYSSQGNYEEALPLFQQTLDIWEKTLGPNHPNTARVLANLGLLHESRGDYSQALDLYRRALSAEDRAFESVFTIASEEQKLRYAQVNEGTLHATLSLIQRHLSHDPAAGHFGLELVLRRKGIVFDAQFKAQASLAKNLEGPALESWEELKRRRGELANLLLRGPAGQSLVSFQQTIRGLEAAIADQEDILAQFSNQFSVNVPQQAITPQSLSQRLPPDAVLVEYFRVQDWDEDNRGWADSSRYLAFTLDSDNSVSMSDLGDADRIDSEIQSTLAAINAPVDYQDAGEVQAYHHNTNAGLARLYLMLIQPVAEKIAGHERLIVSPDGEINKVPFAALRSASDKYMVETHTISYVASGRDLLREEVEVAHDADLVLVANPAYEDQNVFPVSPPLESLNRAPDFNETFPPLPGAAREAQVIAPLIAGHRSILLGRDASETTIKSLKSPRVLHLATHGFFLKDRFLEDRPSALPTLLARSSLVGGDTERGVGGVKNLSLPPESELQKEVYLDPMVRSGIALAGANHAGLIPSGDDGILTALEVTNMDLSGTDLVVLSACQTALGEVSNGEGVFGLRRSFSLAGAENLVMSLWPVSDNATVAQMEQFYAAFENGSAASESLRRAQIDAITKLREQTGQIYGDPMSPVKVWAPFIAQQNTGFP